ncbi:MAG: hypothetical protein LBQ66_07540 [Planctomycetaceae bacterium]|nr:hypothetical protein [Planctomycetaceae bacterium]
MPTNLGVQFKLVRFYYAQRRAGRPRSSSCRFAASEFCTTYLFRYRILFRL